MFRNKLVYIFLVFLCALFFIIGMFGEEQEWLYADVLYYGGQIGLGLFIILFLVVPNKSK